MTSVTVDTSTSGDGCQWKAIRGGFDSCRLRNETLYPHGDLDLFQTIPPLEKWSRKELILGYSSLTICLHTLCSWYCSMPIFSDPIIWLTKLLLSSFPKYIFIVKLQLISQAFICINHWTQPALIRDGLLFEPGVHFLTKPPPHPTFQYRPLLIFHFLTWPFSHSFWIDPRLPGCCLTQILFCQFDHC